MRIITKYITSSILKIALITLFVCMMLVLAVELFSIMNTIINSDASIKDILLLSFLSLPKYLMMVVSISFLFSTTFFLSQLSANNELISLYNSGYSNFRLKLPIILLAIITTIFFFIFSQTVMIRATILHDKMYDELFGLSSTSDNRNITLTDIESNFVIHAKSFVEKSETIYDVTLLETENDSLKRRVEAKYAKYISSNWHFYDVRVYTLDDNNIKSSFYDEYIVDNFKLEPRLFKNYSADITKMSNRDALLYLKRIKTLDIKSYYLNATDYYQRIFSPFSILILMLISCLINYRFKKNIFLFSIIQSLCTAVVYYVGVMVFTISSSQGITMPYISIVAPVVIVIIFSLMIKVVGDRNG